MDGWKSTLAWHYNISCKLVALKLHNSYFCIIAIELHEFHTYMVPHMVSCIRCNSCCKNMLSCNKIAIKLQEVIATQNPIGRLIANHLIFDSEHAHTYTLPIKHSYKEP